MAERKRGLGRGLDALIPQGGTGDEAATGFAYIPLDEIKPNPSQPRTTFDEAALEDLAQSIKQVGVLQPVLVRAREDGFELVAGERRWRAARIAGLAAIPAVIRDEDEEQWHNLTEALIENVQREELGPLEQAAAFNQLMEDFGWTHEQVGSRVAKSRSTITNMLRLLQLPPAIQGMVERGELTGGHAKALLSIDDQVYAEHIAKRAAAEGWSVRMVEEAARARAGVTGTTPSRQSSTAERPAELVSLEERLADRLDARVRINYNGKTGKVVLSFKGLEELERIYRTMFGE
ncbi:MAG: ParB/RepB/Spo0J family partition protein [Acidimicrobiia bacterium]|nr:ParB/RepB/Spo0J family partition protein [Acidimicrobiia bacterium]MBT8215909.1 ParB/RepB/Spo0J family partition protein [Acidimicrobiia bacterium]NNF11293.1 ParB/RepB/Spo0J family partition protein [Acidimicrobiia bacterium]NNL68380.1 ParB/RepB/Spo0J family partition protein [Acidimicrobiia bacterium]